MQDHDSPDAEGWSDFLHAIAAHPRIKESARPFVAKWVERWLREHGPDSEESTTSFFEKIGRDPRLQDWQFRQAVLAVELWCRRVSMPGWAGRFDWQALVDRAEILEDDHPTRLRDAISAARPQLASEELRLRDRTAVDGEEATVAGIVESARHKIRTGGLAAATEKTYLSWIRKFTYFRLRRLRESVTGLPADSIDAYLEYIALERDCAPATQRQVLNAIVYLARNHYGIDEPIELKFVVGSGGRRRLPTVFSREEARRVISLLDDPWRLMAEIAYGTGLRQIEVLRLRVKDLDLDRGIVYVHDGKGGKHRALTLPRKIDRRIREHLEAGEATHRERLAAGVGEAHLRTAYRRKNPSKAFEWAWQWVFPAARLCSNPRTKHVARYHLHPKTLQRRFLEAMRESGIPKNASFHTLRHSYATHSLEQGVDIRTLQELMGHADVSTTMIYLHVMKRPGAGAPSPLDYEGGD